MDRKEIAEAVGKVIGGLIGGVALASTLGLCAGVAYRVFVWVAGI
jgi:hypothetical protein